jgi:CheY-like chemotaxis protein
MDPKKILLVEDDNFIRDLYHRQLEKAGYAVKSTHSGLEAVELVKSEQFDLMLLDIMLPEMDGISVLKKLKEEGKDKLDVMVLSNMGQDDLIKKAMELGAKAYVIKSLSTPAQVVKEIESVIG